MSGTSLDGIDAAVVEIDGHGLTMRARLREHASTELGTARTTLRLLARGGQATAHEVATACDALSRQTASIMQTVIGDAVPDLAGVHGQTIVHVAPLSWQLINASVIAATLRCPVASDMRAGDLASGGHGAPITPLADWILFRSSANRAIVNLGGFCNITWLPSDTVEGVTGRDVCVCNQLLDAAARMTLGTPYDHDGQHAAQGTPDPTLVASLGSALKHSPAERSLGSGDESFTWLEQTCTKDTEPHVLLASITAAIGEHIGKAAVAAGAADIVVAGGGGHHAPLVAAIEAASELPLMLSSELGIPIEAREAACIAILAALDQDDVPITIPGVTGRNPDHPIGMQWCRPLS